MLENSTAGPLLPPLVHTLVRRPGPVAFPASSCARCATRQIGAGQAFPAGRESAAGRADRADGGKTEKGKRRRRRGGRRARGKSEQRRAKSKMRYINYSARRRTASLRRTVRLPSLPRPSRSIPLPRPAGSGFVIKENLFLRF